MHNFLLFGIDFDLGKIIGDFFNKYIGMALYYISWAMCKLVQLFESLFNIFSGTQKVTMIEQSGAKTHDYLINIFFQNSTVNGLYWAMALLAMALVFGFGIVAVARKTFDLRDKQQGQTMGTILGNMAKAILMLVSMTLIMTASISLTNELTASINYAFDHADSFSHASEIHYTDEQFATMARIYKTIGNYSMNPSYNSRFNLNSCFNDIRPDLQYLQDQGVFDFVYVDTETKVDPKSKKEVEVQNYNWQSVLQRIVNSADVSEELPVDEEHTDMEKSLLLAMAVLKKDASFEPLQEYKRQYVNSESAGIDRIVFLTGTANSARNSRFNTNPFLTDGVRGAFFSGEKDIYEYDDVNEVFDTGITGLNNVLIWVLAFLMARGLFRCILACVSRIFNMLGLYIIAPFTIATMPMDDGAKFKQWITSFVVQMLGIFGYIIPMRLVLMFAPIVLSDKLVLYDNAVLNYTAKAVLIVAGVLAVQEFSQIINGILADNAGMASLHSGEKLQSAGMKGFDTVSKYGGAAAGIAAASPVGLAAWGVGAGVYKAGKAIFGKGKEAAGRAHDQAKGKKNFSTDKQDGGGKDNGGDNGSDNNSGDNSNSSDTNQKNLSGTGDKDNGPSGGDNGGDKNGGDTGGDKNGGNTGGDQKNLGGTGNKDNGPDSQGGNQKEGQGGNQGGDQGNDQKNLGGTGDKDSGAPGAPGSNAPDAGGDMGGSNSGDPSVGGAQKNLGGTGSADEGSDVSGGNNGSGNQPDPLEKLYGKGYKHPSKNPPPPPPVKKKPITTYNNLSNNKK